MQERILVGIGIAVVVAAVILLSAGAAAPPRPNPPSRGEFDELSGRVDDHDQEIEKKADAAAVGKLQEEKADKAELAPLEEQCAQNERAIQANADAITLKVGEEEFDALREQVVGNTDEIRRVDGRVDNLHDIVWDYGKILDQISQTDGDRYYPRIESNMQIDDFRKEVDRVVHELIHREGKIFIKNDTGIALGVRIIEGSRDFRITLAPRKTSGPITVSTGNISTQVDGQNPVNWAIGPPDYEQWIRLVPRMGHVTYAYGP